MTRYHLVYTQVSSRIGFLRPYSPRISSGVAGAKMARSRRSKRATVISTLQLFWPDCLGLLPSDVWPLAKLVDLFNPFVIIQIPLD